MSSGMNLEQAKEYAKTMTYSEAVSNVKYGKFIKYRKATMIKLRELAEIADRLDRKTEPKAYCKKRNCVWWSTSLTECLAEKNGLKCKYKTEQTEPQTEYIRVGQAIDSVTGKVLGETYDVPQTDCSWQKGE